MKRIGILSDTHSYWDDKYLHYFEPCDEIWHAGDIGSVEVAEKLAAFRPFRAVCGNCDFQVRGCRCAHQAYRGISRQLRFLRTLHALCQSATTIYRWALTYLEGEIRQDVGAAAYQSWRCWSARLAQGAHPRPPRHRRSRVQGPRSDNIR